MPDEQPPGDHDRTTREAFLRLGRLVWSMTVGATSMVLAINLADHEVTQLGRSRYFYAAILLANGIIHGISLRAQLFPGSSSNYLKHTDDH